MLEQKFGLGESVQLSIDKTHLILLSCRIYNFHQVWFNKKEKSSENARDA